MINIFKRVWPELNTQIDFEYRPNELSSFENLNLSDDPNIFFKDTVFYTHPEILGRRGYSSHFYNFDQVVYRFVQNSSAVHNVLEILTSKKPLKSIKSWAPYYLEQRVLEFG